MEQFSTKKRLKSFTYAWKGIGSFIRKEQNAWIHSAITTAVIICGFLFHITAIEWIAIILCIGLVFAAEAFNTAIERLVNLVSPQQNKTAGDVKDIAAGAVLICAIAAATVGLIIFIPYFIASF
ncbi:diacylglycerol kinase family protein [uncultured Bacteroides sp.]|uniref:diacylglycerol kinase family protein n=1 Tax=uncultured Bacteroides sp. TaxID=162156 RepID=UPI002AABE046|nr:diacylglycerol kinase family protein [uncultured Bacteroides sp.]